MGLFRNRADQALPILAERQRTTEETLEKVLAQVHEIKTALVIRDPGNRLSADAYQGLRQAVIAGANARRSHLVQLAQMAEAINGGARQQDLENLVAEWLLQAGLTPVSDPSDLSLFEVIDGPGESIQVRRPAWIDTQTGAIVKKGTVHRVSGGKSTPPSEPNVSTSAGSKADHSPQAKKGHEERDGIAPAGKGSEGRDAQVNPPDQPLTPDAAKAMTQEAHQRGNQS